MKFSAKVMLLGDIGVGKTSLARRLVFGKFDADYKTTIGVDILTHELKLTGRPEDILAKLLLWDTDGDFGHHIFKSVYIAGASGALVVADASRPATIERMFSLAAGFGEAMPGRPVLGLINKADLVRPDLAGMDLLGLPEDQIMITSAKSGENVAAAFEGIAETIYRRR
jgi:small GTP-binding protein